MDFDQTFNYLSGVQVLSNSEDLSLFMQVSAEVEKAFFASGRSRAYHSYICCLVKLYSLISAEFVHSIDTDNYHVQALLLCACRLAFLRWKLLDDFDETAREIAVNIFAHFDKLIKNTSYGIEQRKSLPLAESPNIVYLSNQLPGPQLSASNAIIEVLRAFIQDRNIAQITKRVSTNLYVVSPGFGNDSYFLSRNAQVATGSQFATYLQSLTMSSALAAISILRPCAIIFDYFSFNQLQLLYNLPFKTHICYHSMGFLPLKLDIVDSLLTFGYAADKSLPSRVPWADALLKKSEIHKPVAHLKRYSSSRRDHIHQVGLNRIKVILSQSAPISLKICTFCRVSKISDCFLAFVVDLLTICPDAEFCIYGSGVPEDKARLLVHERIKLSGPVDVTEMARSNFYLETFPETQGVAICDAFAMRVPVLSIKPINDDFSFTGPRLADAIIGDVNSLRNILVKLSNNTLLYGEFCERQLLLERGIFAESGEVWPLVESFLVDPKL
jgi:hypothetical protein